jgi:hypothetical protein
VPLDPLSKTAVQDERTRSCLSTSGASACAYGSPAGLLAVASTGGLTLEGGSFICFYATTGCHHIRMLAPLGETASSGATVIRYRGDSHGTHVALCKCVHNYLFVALQTIPRRSGNALNALPVGLLFAPPFSIRLRTRCGWTVAATAGLYSGRKLGRARRRSLFVGLSETPSGRAAGLRAYVVC